MLRKTHIGATFALTSVTFTFDSWPIIWTTLMWMVKTLEHFIMIRWQEHCEKGVTGRRTERTYHRAAWSQLKKIMPHNYDRHRHLKFVNPCILSCNQLCRHVWNVLCRYLLCMDAGIVFIKPSFRFISSNSLIYPWNIIQIYIHIERSKTTSMEKGVQWYLEENKIRFEKYTVKRILWEKTPHKLPS